MSRRVESLMCASAYIRGFRVKGRAERAVTNASRRHPHSSLCVFNRKRFAKKVSASVQAAVQCLLDAI